MGTRCCVPSLIVRHHAVCAPHQADAHAKCNSQDPGHWLRPRHQPWRATRDATSQLIASRPRRNNGDRYFWAAFFLSNLLSRAQLGQLGNRQTEADKACSLGRGHGDAQENANQKPARVLIRVRGRHHRRRRSPSRWKRSARPSSLATCSCYPVLLGRSRRK